MATIQLPPWFHSSLHLFGFPRVRSSWKFNQINKLFIIRQFETDRFSFVSFALSRQIIIFVIRSRWRSAVERELMRLAERKGGGKFDLPLTGESGWEIFEGRHQDPSHGRTLTRWRPARVFIENPVEKRATDQIITLQRHYQNKPAAPRPYRRPGIPTLLIKPEWRPLIGVLASTPIKTGQFSIFLCLLTTDLLLLLFFPICLSLSLSLSVCTRITKLPTCLSSL